MDFFKKHKDITVCLIITILVSIGLSVKIVGTSGEILDQEEQIEENNKRADKLLAKDYKISEESLKQAEANLTEVTEKLGDLENSINAYKLESKSTNQIGFKATLTRKLQDIKMKLAKSGITINKQISELSFKATSEKPKLEQVEIDMGSIKLQVIERMFQHIEDMGEDSGITEIVNIKWPTEEFVVAEKSGVKYLPLEFVIAGSQDAIRTFNNLVVEDQKIFSVIRAFNLSNPVKLGKVKASNELEKIKEFKEARLVVTNNRIVWTMFIDIVQFPNEEKKGE